MANSILEKINQTRVLIVGDVMVDSYILGKMDRVSPEAPVPVVSIQKREERLGGAANVALNIQSMGAIPILVGVTGKDLMGEKFLSLLGNARISTDGILQSESRPTTVKHRVMAGNHHVLRIDEESEEELTKDEKMKIHSIINEHIQGCSAVIIEDYDKGLLSKETIDFIRKSAKMANIPVTVDPKKRNFNLYKGFTLFKPNFKELQEGIQQKINIKNLDEVKEAITTLYQTMECEHVFVTLSEHGVMIKTGPDILHIPAHYREISDVSGAGDTVIAVATLVLAAGGAPESIANLANLAGGLVCEHHGVVPIDRKQLEKESS